MRWAPLEFDKRPRFQRQIARYHEEQPIMARVVRFHEIGGPEILRIEEMEVHVLEK